MSKVGVSDFMYAVLTSDTSAGVTYGTLKAIKGLNHIEVTPNSNTATNYGDNAPMEVATAMGEVTISIDSVFLPPEDEAILLGHSIDTTTGAMSYKATDEAPYVGVLFTGLNADGTKRHVKVKKVKFQEVSETYDTKTDSPNFQNPHIEGAAVVRVYDKEWKSVLDESDTNVTSAMVTTFLSAMD